jgi:hypothetical protein
MKLHNGYYTYNGKMFFAREDAFDAMLLNNDLSGQILFNYNDPIFVNINWTKDPKISISSLYRMRAQQIRDKYKYVILSFSGGSDSTQVLQTFLNNDIFIDEIQVSTLDKMTHRFDKQELAKDRDLGYIMEYEYAVKPMLKIVKEKSPDTKITIHDASDYLHDQLSEKKFFPLGNDARTRVGSPRMSPGVGPSFIWWYMYNTINSDKSTDRDGVCIVRGFEKPSIMIDDDNKMYFHFYDHTMISTAAINKGEVVENYTTEDFFWSPDMPFIPVKQCHMILNKFRSDKKFLNKYKDGLKAIDEFAKLNYKPVYSPAIHIERMLCEIIYPNWNPNTFVAPKPTNISPEFKIYELAVGKHFGNDFKKEIQNYKESKYDAILDKRQFYRMIPSKKYYVGDI